MIRLIAVAFALALASSAQAMPPVGRLSSVERYLPVAAAAVANRPPASAASATRIV